MISVNKLHYWFIQGANLTNAPLLKNLSAAERDIYLNEAKDNILEYYAELVETKDLVRQYLKDITIRDIVLNGTDAGEKYIATYPDNMLKPIKVYANATKGTCKRRLKIGRVSSDKIETALKNSHTRRFWDFEKTFGLESEKGFEVYNEPEVGGAKIETVVLDYVRKVANVQGPAFERAERYITEEGDGITANVNLDLKDVRLARRIASLAVLMAFRDRANVPDYEVRYKSIVSIERVFN